MSELTKVQKTKSLLERPEVQEKFKEMLGEKASGFTTSVLSAMNQNEMLKNAEPNSVYMSALMAASLDLPINSNLGFAYIVPYNVKENGNFVVKAQFQIGYKGFKQLAIRTGQFLFIEETDVREGEISERNRLTGEISFNWINDDKERATKNIIGYVSFFRLTSGFESTFYMSIEEVKEHALRYSQSYKKGYGVWKDNFEVMAKKKVSKLNLSKNAPLSIDVIHKAIAVDQSVINDSETIDVEYVDNDEQNQEEAKKEVDNETFEQIKEGVKLETISLDEALNHYNLTDSQISELENL
jgi:recombination protein RecT